MIYNVKPGQNLAEICDEIHLENPDYLRDFHNKNCPLTEYIEGILLIQPDFQFLQHDKSKKSTKNKR